MPERPAVLLLTGGLTTAWNQRYLRAATRRGLRLLVLDTPSEHGRALLERMESDPSHPLAGLVLDAALIDHAATTALVDQAAAWARVYDIRGVCCLKEEYVEANGLIADLLGLPFPGLRAIRVCRNKFLQRRYLAPWSPASTLVAPGERERICDAWRWFPMIVKPIGRLASSGVRHVPGADELRACLTDYEPGETLLFEEPADGPEFSVESLSLRGEVCYAEATQKRTSEVSGDFFVELGHTTPAGLDDGTRQRLLADHAQVLARLGFDTGMAHAEYRIAADGTVRLIEIAARPPGDSIMALHWLATLVPLEDAVVALAVGERPVPRSAVRHARQVYLSHDAGVLAGLDIDPALDIPVQWFDPGEVRAQVETCAAATDEPALRCVVALKPVGTELHPVRESGDRAAMFVVDAATPDQLDVIEERCRAAIAVRVTTGNG